MTAASHHPLSRQLLQLILDDRTSDRFVCELIWQRLGYAPADGAEGADCAAQGPPPWRASSATPSDWAEPYPLAPPLIAERPPSVRLTRSIPAAHKQLLKQQLGFAGYRIGELFPRRTRRATAVNWLLADLAERGEPLAECGPLPPLLDPPADPATGHPIDRPC
ncbi:DUF1823 family protein [Synechococcus sp. ATX 2A4]|uniref:DUF1823 family protein n=1 Tax=Synechococcus sp. ATX 2A4 TaxID=2823727 RepID=UPI0020CEC376|nr:DUF1823 family protein [Synechococcus sp. ATX 2A4]MCP9885051.1 DUF1823 family protein [Synechococcus sp. ATX 2A4]